MQNFLDFEKPIASLEGKVEELRHMSSDGSINIADEIGKTPRGVKTMLTRRGLTASDYDGAAKAAKAAQ